MFFQGFYRFFGSLTQFFLKSELFVRLSDFVRNFLVISLLLALHEVAETAFLLIFLKFFPGVRTESVIHLDSLLFELDERAAALGHQSFFSLLLAVAIGTLV